MTRPGGHAHAQALVANGHAPFGADLEGGSPTPEVGPPGATRGWAQHPTLFALGGPRSGVGRALKCAMDFVGVAVTAPVWPECVGGCGRGDIFGGEEGGQAALPVWVLALDFAFGLGRAGVAEGRRRRSAGRPRVGSTRRGAEERKS